MNNISTSTSQIIHATDIFITLGLIKVTIAILIISVR